MQKEERLILQVEQSVYLRFWEADTVLKRYHQLASLAIGKPYDWHLTIPSHSRQGSKHEFIRKGIRDRVKSTCPNFFALIEENYQTQIRDAIGHSQFYLVGRAVCFLNHSTDPAAHTPLATISFDDWYRRFHTTLLLHNETIGAFQQYRRDYEGRARANGNRLEVRITRQNRSETFHEVALHPNGRWSWKEHAC